MADFQTVTELVREHAYLRSLRDRWSVGFERLRRLDLPGGDEPDANLPAMAADEIDRLRAEVEAWRTAAQGAGAQAVRLRELIQALNIRMVQPFMGGGGQFQAHGTLTADQWAIIAEAFEEDDRDA